MRRRICRATSRLLAGLTGREGGSQFSSYSGGYSTVPDAWGASQGEPQA